MKFIYFSILATAIQAQKIALNCSKDSHCDQGQCCGSAELEGEPTRRICNQSDSKTWLDEENDMEY